MRRSKTALIPVPEGREKNVMNLDCVLMTKLSKKDKVVLVSFKKMELSVIEITESKETIVEKVKYGLGDIGKGRYTRRIREYEAKGFEVDGQTSNMDIILKDQRKKKGDENDKLL